MRGNVNDPSVNRELKSFDIEVKRAAEQLERDKVKIANEIKSKLGKQMMSYDSYIKKPNRRKLIKQKFKAIWHKIKNVMKKI